MYDRSTLNGPKTFEIISQGERSRIPLIVHIPHSSVFIPEDERLTFCHSDLELNDELLRMTDRYTDDLFSEAIKLGGTLFVNRVSRLVCDPELYPEE